MRRLAVAVLLAAGAHASTGGKPRSDLPPLFLVPSLCGSRIRAWSAPQCTIGSISPGTNTSRVMTTSTNSVLIGGAGPGAPMAPAVAVKPMSVDEKNRAIRARAVAEAKK